MLRGSLIGYDIALNNFDIIIQSDIIFLPIGLSNFNPSIDPDSSAVVSPPGQLIIVTSLVVSQLRYFKESYDLQLFVLPLAIL